MNDPTTVDEFVAGLRALAEFYEQRPDMPLPSLKLGVYEYHAASLPGGVERAGAVAQLMSPCVKGADEQLDFFTLTRAFGPISLVWRINRAAVCERREVTRVVTEWVCPDSLLGAASGGAQ